MSCFLQVDTFLKVCCVWLPKSLCPIKLLWPGILKVNWKCHLRVKHAPKWKWHHKCAKYFFERTKYYSARIDVNSTVCKGKDRKNVITSQTKPGKQLMNGKVQNGTTSEERIFNPNLHLSKAFAQQVLKGKRLKMKDWLGCFFLKNNNKCTVRKYSIFFSYSIFWLIWHSS